MAMKKVLLLVEDDEDNRDLVMFVLKRSQMDIDLIVAENGKEAIELAIDRSPALILMDMQMPVMDGWTAIPILKGDTRTKAIPVIAFTAQVRKEDQERALSIGCAEHYAKPMDPEELLNVIRKYLIDKEK